MTKVTDCAGLGPEAKQLLSVLNEQEIHNLIIGLINEHAIVVLDGNRQFLADNQDWFTDKYHSCEARYLERNDGCRCAVVIAI